MNKNALLIIDPQNDFCNPDKKTGKNKGSLYVPGADKDMKRLAKWIKNNSNKISYIAITMDWHQPMDIAHPFFWKDEQGEHPQPFTQITYEDANSGKYIPVFEKEKSIKYLKELEEQGEYPHLIWPPHCIAGSFGAVIYKPLMKEIEKWAAKGNLYDTILKGTYPYSEHFGAFRAQIPDSNIEETLFNKNLSDKLCTYDKVYLAGEAKSHCVANTLKQIMEENSVLAKKIVILTDTMSNVTGFENIADPIYKNAKDLGIEFTTTEIYL